jgi:hypothetical protein
MMSAVCINGSNARAFNWTGNEFINCSSSSRTGGAIHLDVTSPELLLVECRFTNCTSSVGGILCFLSIGGNLYVSL